MVEIKKVQMAEAVFTDELLQKMRSKSGMKLQVENSVWNEEATRLAIAKFADGIGDPNPLWSDLTYAKKTRYGDIVAPPSWVVSVFSGLQFGWKGMGGFHNSSDMEFYKPIMIGDRITPECTYKGFEGPKPSKFAEKMVIDAYENVYTNQMNQQAAKIKWSVVRVERATARKKGKYSSIVLPHPWTEEELKKIEEEVLSENPRGSKTRYWEDVKVGEDLQPIVKGIIGLTDEIAFIVGGGPPIPRLGAHRVQLQRYRKQPAWAFRDPNTFALEPIYAVHYNKEAAKAMGLPMPYDVGYQRHCWQIHLLTDWMGDDGWLKRSYAEYRRFVYLSDVIWLKGKVTKKYVDDNCECCVDIKTSSLNQRGEEVMPGNATVILPSREKGISPLDNRLR